MYTKLLAGWSVVRGDVRARSQGREESVEVVSRNDILQKFDGSGHFGAIFIELDIMKIQIENVPIARVVAIRPDTVFRDVVLICVGR